MEELVEFRSLIVTEGFARLEASALIERQSRFEGRSASGLKAECLHSRRTRSVNKMIQKSAGYALPQKVRMRAHGFELPCLIIQAFECADSGHVIQVVDGPDFDFRCHEA